ncbi:hypothetical protein A9Q95_03340 [Rhodobacterales bacterium 59_46_T64]|nr:hypothetical protein A9Q95_03340 [Rhodobacterales bacterium 59_46_T64]
MLRHVFCLRVPLAFVRGSGAKFKAVALIKNAVIRHGAVVPFGIPQDCNIEDRSCINCKHLI